MEPTDIGLVRVLYTAVRSSESLEVGRSFAVWRERFAYTHGELERKRAVDRDDLARRYGLLEAELDLETLIFALEGYTAARLLLRVLGAASQLGLNTGDADRTDAASLSGRLLMLARGELTGAAGVDGFELHEGLRWVLPVLSGHPEALLEIAMREFLLTEARLLSPAEDVLRDEYHDLFPKELRHALGAYYTPLWLAEHALAQSGFNLDAVRGGLSVLDPTCGSGAYFVVIARMLQDWVGSGVLGVDAAIEYLTEDVQGVDLSPLAILGVRTNILLAVAGLRSRSKSPSRPFRLLPILGNSLTLKLSDLRAEPFDFVVGNPPWVNWEYLPPTYREDTAPLWPEMGLFDLGGRDRAFSKEDISGLFVYVAADKYLRDGGMLSFLLPQSLFQSALNGRKFREFCIRGTTPLGIVVVEDFVAVKPFEGVANRTALLLLQKGKLTSYPVPYLRWTRAGRARIDPDCRSDAALGLLQCVQDFGSPIDVASAAWVTGPSAALEVLPAMIGVNPYRARTGIFTGGANGVYYLSVEERLANGNLLVRNITERAKRVVDEVVAEIEPTYVFPLLRGREVSPWRSQGVDYILCPHTIESRMDPVDESQLKAEAPLTFEYLEGFRRPLAERAGFAGWERAKLDNGFYAIQRVGAYTFAPYKLVWRYIASEFMCAVVSPRDGKPQLPNEKLMLIAADNEMEAHYLCGSLSSNPARWFVESRMVSTQIAPHVIEQLSTPAFDPNSPLHLEIADYSLSRHSGMATNISRLDTLAADLFKLTRSQVAAAAAAVAARST